MSPICTGFARIVRLGAIALGTCIPLSASAEATVTATGFAFCYEGKNEGYKPMEGMRVDLMDSDCEGSQICDDEMGHSYVRHDGSFSVMGHGGDGGLIGADPDVYLRFAYNDDEGVRLTDELDTTRSWNTPEHEHDNSPDGSVIDFGAWSTGNGVGDNEGTPCRVWQEGRKAFGAYRNAFGRNPPAGHLDIEYLSVLSAGTPWTNTDTIHWPTHYPAFAMPHEFGHSIRHAADGNGAHFALDVVRYQYARNHETCATDGNRNPSESDDSLRAYAFNEGWAHYWAGQTDGCGSTDARIEGNVARMLLVLQDGNHLTRADMLAVLLSNPGSIHNLNEFRDKLATDHPGVDVNVSALSTPLRRGWDIRAPQLAETRQSMTSSQLAESLNAQAANLRKQAESYRLNKEVERCKDCSRQVHNAVASALLLGDAKMREARALIVATHPDSARLRAMINTGRYDDFIAAYRTTQGEAIRRAMIDSIEQAKANVRKVRPASSSADERKEAIGTLAKARARLDGSNGTRGWLPQLPLAEDVAQKLPQSPQGFPY